MRAEPQRAAVRLRAAAALAAWACGAMAQPQTYEPLPSIDTLRARVFDARLVRERSLPDGPNFRAYLVGYSVAGLSLHAFVAVPVTPRPPGGYPVLLANHGTHPNPPRYGFTAAGVDSRPGDYCRAVPALYAAEGFLVVMPDYRGHNVSEGVEYTAGTLSGAYYAEDVLALLGAIGDLPEADAGNVFLWGHSLGGEVGLRVLLATDRIRAASLWAPVCGDPWEKTAVYALYGQADVAADDVRLGQAFDRLSAEIARQPAVVDADAHDPLRHLAALSTPIMLQHAVSDPEVGIGCSLRFAAQLQRHHKPYTLHRYPVADHFLASPERETAVARDVAFFRSRLNPSP